MSNIANLALHVRRNKLYAFYLQKKQVRSYRKRETCEI